MRPYHHRLFRNPVPGSSSDCGLAFCGGHLAPGCEGQPCDCSPLPGDARCELDFPEAKQLPDSGSFFCRIPPQWCDFFLIRGSGRACDVQKFWLAYIKAANGNLSPENYGPALMNFGQ